MTTGNYNSCLKILCNIFASSQKLSHFFNDQELNRSLNNMKTTEKNISQKNTQMQST